MRGLCIATGEYSSLCVSAVVSILGGSDGMEVDKQDREQVDNERESRGARGRGRRQIKNRQRTLKHVMTCAWVILSDTRCDTLSHNVTCAQSQSVREKVSCEVYLSTHSVGYSGSLLTVNETNCNKKRFELLKNL